MKIVEYSINSTFLEVELVKRVLQQDTAPTLDMLLTFRNEKHMFRLLSHYKYIKGRNFLSYKFTMKGTKKRQMGEEIQ